MTFRVEVTAEDIDRGVRNDCWLCPVALALCRAPRVDAALVGVTQLFVDGPRHRRYFADAPLEVQDFIRAFDSGEPVEPFSFDVEFPDWPAETAP